MKTSIKRGESLIILGVAAALIAIGALSLGEFLSSAGMAGEGIAHAETVAVEPDALTDEVRAPDLDIKIDLRGEQAPADCVSAQYAVAAAADVAEHVYGMQPTGRAFVTLLATEQYMAPSLINAYAAGAFVWNVNLQTDAGNMLIDIDPTTGKDIGARISTGTHDWTWFDNWDDEGAEEQRIADEQAFQDKLSDPDSGAISPDPLSDEELARIHAQKRAGMLEFADTMIDAAQGERAVAFANDLDLGNGAVATAGRVMMEGSSLGYSIYVVEVSLDDGSYLFMDLTQEIDPATSDYLLVGYDRSTVDYATFAYGA